MNPVTTVESQPGLVRVAHIVYGLHALGLAIGAFGASSVVGAFLFGWPSIIAVIINYVKRDSVRGTFLDTHFSWQIRTFWWAVGWFVVAWLMIFTVIGALVGIPVMLLVGVWVLYRIIRGWIALAGRKPMPLPPA